MDSLPPERVEPIPAPAAEPAGMPALTLVPSKGLAAELTPAQQQSQLALFDLLGEHADKKLAQVVMLPSAEDKALTEARTVQEAMPLIANMLKADKAAQGIKKPYPRTALKHQHIVAFMLCNPFATTTEICSFFGISPTTLGNINKSDTFQSLIAAHRVSLESGIGADLQDQLRQTMAAAIEVVQKAVVTGQNPDYALEVMDKAANRMGMGNKHQTNVQINNNVITPEMIAAARASRRLPS